MGSGNSLVPRELQSDPGQGGEKSFPRTADQGLGGSANRATGLPEAPAMTTHVTAKEHSGKEWAGPPGCRQKLPPQLSSASLCLPKVLKPTLPAFSFPVGPGKAVTVSR